MKEVLLRRDHRDVEAFMAGEAKCDKEVPALWRRSVLKQLYLFTWCQYQGRCCRMEASWAPAR